MSHPLIDQLLNRLFGKETFRRIARNAGYLFSTTTIGAAMGMLQGILTARLLGVTGYGILGAVIMFTSLVNKFVSFRMSELVVKYVGQFSERSENRKAAAVFKAALLAEFSASLIAFGLVWLLAPLGAQFLAKDNSTASIFILYGLVILANLVAESSNGLLQTFDRFRRIALLSVLQSVVSLVLIGVIYLTAGNLQQVVSAYIIGKLTFGLGISLAAFGEARRQWGAGWQRTPLSALKGHLGELARFAFHTNISATINLINKDSELFWVSFFRGPTETGLYKLALTLANIVELPITPLPNATYPELSRQVARGDWQGMRQVLRRGTLLAGAYSLAAVIFLFISGRWIIQYIYSPDFLPSYPALLILLTGYLIGNTVYWRRVSLLALGRADFPAKVNLILAAAKLVGILLLVPRFGFLASAALLAAFYWAGSLASVWKTRALLTAQVLPGQQLPSPLETPPAASDSDLPSLPL